MNRLDVKDLTAVADFVRENYALSGTLHPLAGEVDLNYRLDTPTGVNYLLKISGPDATEAEIDFQRAILAHLADREDVGRTPTTVPDRTGRAYVPIMDKDSHPRYLRIHTWVPGRMLEKVRYRSPELLTAWGA